MKFFLVNLLLLIVSVHVSAQKLPLRFGIKAGLNFSEFEHTVTAPELLRNDPDNGFYAGIQFDIPFGKRFSLQPEIFYIQSRIQDYFPLANPVIEQINHFSMPVLAKLKLGHLGIYTGPQISLRQRVYTKYTDYIFATPSQNAVPASVTTKTDVTDSSFSSTNVSLIAGLEYTFSYRFGVDIRYQLGLSNIRSDNAATFFTYPTGQEIKLHGLQTGIYFRFGKKPKKSKERSTTSN